MSDLDFRFGGFNRLMPFRVEQVLLVSSLYESFILEEDGMVAEMITSEYVDMELSRAPQVFRVSSPAEALNFLKCERIDLVITMTRLGEWNVGDFAKAVKETNPELPVVVLAGDLRELSRHAESIERNSINRFFVWNGNAKIFLAIIKLIEDELNAEHDTRVGNVRIIILIENSVRFYSTYLPLIYTEMVKLTQALMDEGINRMQRLLRLRARPKILLAETHEEALELYSRFGQNLLGVISDIRFPRDGKLNERAGLDIAERLIRDSPDVSVILQSTAARFADEARRLGVGFVNKKSPTLLQDLREFIQNSMGFGDFVFAQPDGTVVGRASDLRSFREMVEQVPDECLTFHATHNHFSNWLMARTEFDLALRIRPKKVSDFETVEEMRAYLLDQLSKNRQQRQRGLISDFSARTFDEGASFTRIGGGSMGGKARGLAFMSALLRRHQLVDKYPGVHVDVPRSCAIGTDVFDSFLDKNHLHTLLTQDVSDDVVARAFRKAKISRNVHRKLRTFIKNVHYPIAVRSSSLLEDSQDQSFAGVYTTHMLPNSHPSEEVRLEQLCEAVKLVYASIFFRDARLYLDATAHHIEGEKMGVILQEIVGSHYDSRFYPTFSGVARSYNYYSTARYAPEDGVAHVALGLGKEVVEGGRTLMFSPAHPKVLPQFNSTRAMLANSQSEFFALEIDHPDVYPSADANANMVKLGLDVAEADGVLTHIGSVYSPDNDSVYDGLSRTGPRLVTFAHVLKSDSFPLADILKDLLDVGIQAMGCPIEIEFAVDMSVEPMRFGFLQIRPIAEIDTYEITVTDAERQRALCWTPQAMGNGLYHDVQDVIYVRPDMFSSLKTMEIANEIGVINDQLRSEGRGCVLIGPGRWGSADRFLGIPVTWPQISTAKAIVETTLQNFTVEPSQGTHFFQNLTSFRVMYFTVDPIRGHGNIDWDWLSTQTSACEYTYVRHLRLDAPLEIKVDGRSREGIIAPADRTRA